MNTRDSAILLEYHAPAVVRREVRGVVEAAVHEQLVPLLRRVGLFSRCSDYELRIVARYCTLREAVIGETVIVGGDDGSEMYLVLEGAAEAIAKGEVRHRFGPGDYFGELAVVRPAPRTSDVVATAPSLFAVLGRSEVMLLLDAIPGVAKSMLRGLAETVHEVASRAASETSAAL